jgi:3-oxoacyl-[acyl-carrier protein] reductase
MRRVPRLDPGSLTRRGSARGAEVDATDEDGVRGFVDAVAEEAGRLDVSFDLISVGDEQGTPLVEMEWADFMRPIETAVQTNFLTVKAAAPHVVRFVTLRTAGIPDTIPDVMDGGEELAVSLAAMTMTAATVNVSAGALIDH